MPRAINAQLDAVMRQTFALQARTDAGLHQQVDGALLQNAGANTRLDVLSGADFQNNGFDSLQLEKMGERQTGGTRSDNSDLRAHRNVQRKRSMTSRGMPGSECGGQDRWRARSRHVFR